LASQASGCTDAPIGEITVATLNNAPIVTLMANGHPVILLLDTGAERTVLTPTVAERIAAQPARIEFQRQMHGIVGVLPAREVELSSFRAGNVPIDWRRIAVAPVTGPTVFSGPLDGILGADVLSSFDLDLDLPHHRLRFFQKGSCRDGPPWTGPHISIATGRSRGEHLFFPVELDGRRIIAIIDTGAQHTFVSDAAARLLGIDATRLAHDPLVTVHSATAGQVSSHVHRFSELKVGSYLMRNPELLIGGANFSDCDIVLGVDFIGPRRVWFSYSALEIFLSPS
jgi:predicted aspartyl protease